MMSDKTSAVEQMRRMEDCFHIADIPTFCALIGSVIDAPVDADGNVLHVGDVVTCWALAGEKRVTSFQLFTGHTWKAYFGDGASWPCHDLHKVMPDSRERIEADAEMTPCDYFGHDKTTPCDGCKAYGRGKFCASTMARDLVRRCFALMDGEGR